MNRNIQKVTVKGIVCKNKKVFMLKDQKGNWELPGGRIKFGESAEDTLKREFKEELGIKNIIIGKLVHVWDFTSNSKGNNNHFIVIVYKCKADLNKVDISREHLEYQWVDIKEISDYQMRSGYLEVIKKIYFNT